MVASKSMNIVQSNHTDLICTCVYLGIPYLILKIRPQRFDAPAFFDIHLNSTELVDSSFMFDIEYVGKLKNWFPCTMFVSGSWCNHCYWIVSVSSLVFHTMTGSMMDLNLCLSSHISVFLYNCLFISKKIFLWWWWYIGMLNRTTDRHNKQPLRAHMITGAHAHMLAKSCAWTHRHMDIWARMLA